MIYAKEREREREGLVQDACAILHLREKYYREYAVHFQPFIFFPFHLSLVSTCLPFTEKATPATLITRTPYIYTHIARSDSHFTRIIMTVASRRSVGEVSKCFT